ncbi:MAG: hypothetical protein A3B66_05190 [Alphaproteobacteria bacterium RIFCSPHIGHO2_02_FULL_46_13]|nr:MAG: hypothetical protein A3B66_05190 [Alphaproteobacteria bacterium RIFCSPHIGHO2_02_FULL_46_13]
MKLSTFVILTMAFCGLSRSAQADNWCNPTKAPTINIKTSTDQISYNFSLSEKQLNSFETSTVSPYASNIITDVGGLMKGGIETQQRMSFQTMTNQRTQQVCFWHDTIEVMLHIKPTIFIASEFPQGTCMHNSIMGHEQKHIQVDREIVNKYAALIGQALQNDVSRYRVFGPFPASNQDAALEQVKTRMQNILRQYSNQMSAERKARQQQVDNLAEYERVNKSCKRSRP